MGKKKSWYRQMHAGEGWVSMQKESATEEEKEGKKGKGGKEGRPILPRKGGG